MKTGMPLLAMVLATNFASAAQAQEAVAPSLPTFTVLHNFTGSPDDGADPSGPLVLASDGSYYGPTNAGGAFNKGAIYRRSPDGNVSVVYSFTGGVDGGQPTGALVLDEHGNLYGTTSSGGNPDCGVQGGCGVVFRLATNGIQTVLHAFSGGEGALPQNGLIRDAAGNLYGTTQGGGDMSCTQTIPGCGVAFELAPDGTYNVLHTFSFTPTGGDGAYPSALLRDGAGNLYGTATLGTGANGNSDGIFKLEPDGTYTILFTFTNYTTQGRNPIGGLVGDPAGNLYGVTFNGGANNQGVAYKLAPNGTYTVLYTFTGGSDGGNPQFSLYRNPRTGLLYGTAFEGGAWGCGTAFVLSPSLRRQRTLYNFGCSDTASFPVYPLIKGQGRELVGASLIGTGNRGTLYRLEFGGQ